MVGYMYSRLRFLQLIKAQTRCKTQIYFAQCKLCFAILNPFINFCARAAFAHNLFVDMKLRLFRVDLFWTYGACEKLTVLSCFQLLSVPRLEITSM